MRITVFGANGAIANHFVNHALKAGHTLNLYARRLTEFDDREGIQSYVGNLTEYDKIKNAIEGSDAVVSFLGPALKFSYPGTPIEDGHRNITIAMNELGIKRFMTIATPSVKFHKDKRSFITVFPSVMAKTFMPKPYKEIVAAGEITKNSGLDWTIIRFLAPVNGVAKMDWKVTFGETNIKFKITREDIALFALEELKENRFIQSMPIIGS